MKYCCLTFIALASFLVPSVCQARTWTNDNGITLEGALAGIRETEIDLMMNDGRVVSIPRQILSGSDQDYVNEWERRLADGEVLPQADETSTSSPQEIEDRGEIVATNWMAPWPQRVGKVQGELPQLIQQEKGLLVYETKHFRWESPCELTKEELCYLSTEMEAALSTLAALPMNLRLALDPPSHYPVRLVFDPKEWNEAGGHVDERIKVEETYFMIFLKRTSKGDAEELTRVRPLHMVSHWVFQFLGKIYWLNEGMACYLDAMPSTPQGVSFDDDIRRVAYTLPRTIRKGSIPVPGLQNLMTQQGTPNSNRKTRLRYESAAMIVTTYFTRMQGDGNRKLLRKYLQQVQRDPSTNPIDILLEGKSWKTLESDIAQAWKKYGVILKFEDSPSPLDATSVDK